MKSSNGFSLIEVLLSLALVGVVLALTLPFLHFQKRLWSQQEDVREGYRNLTSALVWLTRDLQQAGYHCLESPLHQLEETFLSYELSRDEDGPAVFSPANGRLISVFLDGRDLKYRIQRRLSHPKSGWNTGSTYILASGLSRLRFKGLDAEGNPASSPEQSPLVEISLAGEGGVELKTLVYIRNPRPEAGS